jgi:hypothetical protein
MNRNQIARLVKLEKKMPRSQLRRIRVSVFFVARGLAGDDPIRAESSGREWYRLSNETPQEFVDRVHAEQGEAVKIIFFFPAEEDDIVGTRDSAEQRRLKEETTRRHDD